MRVCARQHAAMQALPDRYISSNDIVFATAWLLGCAMLQHPPPGQAPPGSASVGLIAADLVVNDLQGRLSRALVPAGQPLCLSCEQASSCLLEAGIWHTAMGLQGGGACLHHVWCSVGPIHFSRGTCTDCTWLLVHRQSWVCKCSLIAEKPV